MATVDCYGKLCLLCAHIGPIVQWIEYQIPVLTIRVRLPMGSQDDKKRQLNVAFFVVVLISASKTARLQI